MATKKLQKEIKKCQQLNVSQFKSETKSKNLKENKISDKN